MGLGVMTDSVRIRLQEVRKKHIKAETYPSIVASTIRKQVGEKRPKNLFPMPTYSHLKGYTDIWAQRTSLELRDIQDELGEAYSLINSYLSYL